MSSPQFERTNGFRIRANFPNLQNLRTSAQQRQKGRPKTVLPGGLPAKVEWETRDAGPPRLDTIQVRDIDVLFLCDTDQAKAQTHLSLILEARKGNPAAQQTIQGNIQTFFQEHFPGGFPPDVIENEYIVPSLSQNTYTVDELSHKGSILLQLSQGGFSVPDFVIYSAKNYLLPSREQQDHIKAALHTLTSLALPGVGPNHAPLVFAIRCAMPVYIPGMMHTFLNVGVTKNDIDVLAATYGHRAAKRMFLNNLKNYLQMVDATEYAVLIKQARQNLSNEQTDTVLRTISDLIKRTDPQFLENPVAQANFFVQKAYAHFEENLDLLITFMGSAQHYPSLIFQKMVCTVRHPCSYAGVLYSRHPRSGVGMQLQVARDIFGEDIMMGTIEPQDFAFRERAESKPDFPAVYHFSERIDTLEEEFQSPVTVEFAVDATDRFELFALLQLNCSELSGRAAFISIMDLYRSGKLSRQRVIELIRPFHFKQLESDTIDSGSFRHLRPFSQGVPVLPRTALSARAYFSAKTALSAKKTKDKVCFFQERFVPSDTIIMREVDAIICGTPAAIHVVTLCQGYGIPALLNLSKYGNYFSSSSADGRRCIMNERGEEITEGDWVTISSSRNTLYRGRAEYQPARLIRYMAGEDVPLSQEEKVWFNQLASAYQDYQALVSHLELTKIAGIRDLIKLVRYQFKDKVEKQERMVNDWYDANPDLYLSEVFSCEMGAHLNQQTIYHLLTTDRQIEFFKRAADKCISETRSGLSAGSFTLGRFINTEHPVRFWESLTARQIAILINEWVLFEKYMDVLMLVGERRISRAREQIMHKGLNMLSLAPARITSFMTLKLSSVDVDEVMSALPKGSDEQAKKVIELLKLPFSEFYDYESPWSVGQLRKICRAQGLALPDPAEM